MGVSPYTALLTMGFVVLLFNSGARFALSLMLHPMAADLGWSRTTLSSVVTVFMVLSALLLPAVGQLADRFGPRLVLAAGIVVSGVSLGLMGLINAPWQAVALYGLLFSFGSAATSITPIGVMLTRSYPEKAGMANSIAISGMGVGQLVIVSLLAAQLASLGWRGAYAMLGIAMIVCVLPLVVSVGRRMEQSEVVAAPESDVAASSGSIWDVVRGGRFWLLAVMYAICGFQDFLVATHVVAFALDEGVSPLLAGNMLAFMGLAGLAGVLLSGALNDRFGARVPTGLCFAIRVVVFAAILQLKDPPVIVAVALGYGFTFWITAPLTVVYSRALTGLAMLGTLTGLITMIHHAAGGLGALVGARIFDVTGNYDLAMTIMLVTSLVALVLTPGLPRTRAAR
tara:strand:+ start:542 stop:1735 length:1194 start_codon:yes stop_codon:yes gene_type:complete